MLRNFLVSVHKYYAQSHGGYLNYPIMPAIVVGLSFFTFFAGIDMSLNESRLVNRLLGIHQYLLVVLIYLLIFIFYLYYRLRLPTKQELRDPKGKWVGVIICIVCVLFAMLSSM